MVKVRFVNLEAQLTLIKDVIISKITSFLESGYYIFGPELNNFEKSVAEYCESKFAIGVGNGTDALFLSLKALGIGNGDEVITVPNSFIATACAISATGAKPVFIDVKDDFTMNPNLIEQAITEKTKAIIPVHLTGKICDMDPILEIAKKHNLFVIEDAAQSIGSKYKGKKSGSFGDFGCFSLHPLKNLNCFGDGGFITTNNEELYNKLLLLRNHGLINRDECVLWGYNSRLDSLQAAILSIKISDLDKTKERINYIVNKYKSGLKNHVEIPSHEDYDDIFYHTFIIKTDKRNELKKYLLEKGIETSIHYPIPIHLQEAARELRYRKGDFPIVEKQAETILSLPLYPELTNEQIDLIIKEISSFNFY